MNLNKSCIEIYIVPWELLAYSVMNLNKSCIEILTNGQVIQPL